MDGKWIKKWQDDLEQLKDELPRKHKNLYHQQSQKNFFNDIDELIDDIEELDHFMVISRIAEIVASIRDAHTSLMTPGKWFLPFEFYWFEEGIYIVDGLGKADFFNKRVTHINNVPVGDIIERLARIISHENDLFLKSQLPNYLKVAEVLYGLEIIDDLSKVCIGLENSDGNITDIIVETSNKANYSSDISMDCDLPLFRKNKGKRYWSHFIEARKLLYINYNSCRDMDDIEVVDAYSDDVIVGVVCFFKEMLDRIYRDKVECVVIDLRNNLGGDSTLLEPFIKDLKAWKNGEDCSIRVGSYCDENRVVYSIVGRDTFSSALLNAYALKNDLGAIILGEPSGGKPNCYGEVLYLELKNSRLKVRYSTKYYEIVEDNNQLSLVPDVVYDVFFKDYINCKDPVMEYILEGKVE